MGMPLLGRSALIHSRARLDGVLRLYLERLGDPRADRRGAGQLYPCPVS